MKKFSTIRKIYEQEEVAPANLPQVDQQPENVVDQTGKIVQPEPQPQEGENAGSAVSLFSKLFESREMAHIYHLQVNGEQGSHAAHTALNEYYEGILELIDDLIETYQGQYGIVDGYDVIDTNTTRTKEKVEYFESLVEFVKHGRKAISAEDTHLHSIIDDIVVLIYKTLYKLKFTK
jgi:hypothetical protein